MNAAVYRSVFVPHDLKAPLIGAPEGPLAGLTAVLKDMYAVAGERAGGGNPDLLAAAPVAGANAPTVQQLLDAGASIVGKVICEEFFYSVTGANAHYGTPVNARAPGRLPGGSSSGSAAAVGVGICDIALGSDTGGSVRIPASFNGIYGLRPTLGRVNAAGVMDMAPSFDVPGWFAATPGVFRNVGAVLLDDRQVAAAIERVIVLEDAFAEADAPLADALRTLLEFMADDLPPIAHAKIAPDGFDPWREAMRILQAREVWQTFGAFVTRHHPKMGPGIRERMAFAATVTQEQAAVANEVRVRAVAHIRQSAPPGTVLALPTAPCIAPRVDTPEPELDHYRSRVMRLTCTASLAGLPQVSIPAVLIDGCPAGLSFIGWPGGDEALLDLAVRLSRHCGMTA
jgi:amidase